MSMHTNNWVTGDIFSLWSHFNIQWPPVTSNDFWGQMIYLMLVKDIIWAYMQQIGSLGLILDFDQNYLFDLFDLRCHLWNLETIKYSLFQIWVSYKYVFKNSSSYEYIYTSLNFPVEDFYGALRPRFLVSFICLFSEFDLFLMIGVKLV